LYVIIALFGMAAWIVFCIRDYWLLEAFAGRQKSRAIRWYLASVVCATALIALLWQIFPRPEALLLSPALLIPTLGMHAVFFGWSMWVCQRGRFSTAWKLILLPPPAAWILLLLSSSAMSGGDRGQTALITAAIAIGSGVTVALAGSRFTIDEGSRDDLVFPIRFAACSNCLALCLLPFLVW
jgi:hypothetical protein